MVKILFSCPLGSWVSLWNVETIRGSLMKPKRQKLASLASVNCWVIIHCLLVSCTKINHLRYARVICFLYNQHPNSELLLNHSLLELIYFLNNDHRCLFHCINTYWVPREILNTLPFGHMFKQLPQDLANVNAYFIKYRTWRHDVKNTIFITVALRLYV